MDGEDPNLSGKDANNFYENYAESTKGKRKAAVDEGESGAASPRGYPAGQGSGIGTPLTQQGGNADLPEIAVQAV